MIRHGWRIGTLLVGLMSGAVPISGQQATSEQIVSACAEAMGGQRAIDRIETIRLRYRLPDHGGPSHLEIKRPNLLRVANYLVFDGVRAAILEQPQSPDGSRQPAELIPSEEWKDFEMEIGWFFPAFFDFPVEYEGVEVIDAIETHRLAVSLPLGARLVYYIDTETSLPVMLESFVTVRGRHSRYLRRFGDYREVEGFLYPHSFTYYSHHVKEMFTVTIEELELNVPLDDSRFAIPAALGVPEE